MQPKLTLSWGQTCSVSFYRVVLTYIWELPMPTSFFDIFCKVLLGVYAVLEFNILLAPTFQM